MWSMIIFNNMFYFIYLNESHKIATNKSINIKKRTLNLVYNKTKGSNYVWVWFFFMILCMVEALKYTFAINSHNMFPGIQLMFIIKTPSTSTSTNSNLLSHFMSRYRQVPTF